MPDFRPNALYAALAYAIRTAQLPKARHVAWLALATSSLSQAAPQVQVNFDIAAGPLQTALVAFAATTKVSLQFGPEIVKDKKTEGVKGNHAISEALDGLLKGTGLRANQISENVYTIEKSPAAPTEVAPKTGEVKAKDLATIYVTAAASKDYIAARSSTASRTDTELGQTPQTIDVVTRAMLDQTQATSVYEALKNVPGVTISGADGFNGQVYLRGMNASVAIDGTTDGASGIAYSGFRSTGLGTPTIAVQGVEVLKGADAIIAGSPGGSPNFGLINVERKKPQVDPIHEVTLESGSYGHKQVGIDFAGALNEEKSLSYRLVAETHDDDNSPGGYTGSDGNYLAPSVAYTYGSGSLLAGIEFQRSTTPPPLWGRVDFDGSIVIPGKPQGESGDHAKLSSDSQYVEWKQVLPDEWNLKVKLNNARTTSWSSYYALTTPDFSSWVLSPTNSKSSLAKNDLDLSVNHAFRIGATEHKFLLGGNLQRLSIKSGISDNYSLYALSDQLPTLTDYNGEMRRIGKITDTSFFVQDQIHWKDLYVLAAVTKSSEWGRYDIVNRDLPRESATNPSVGALYQINSIFSVYANAKTSFSPQASVTMYDNSIAPPQKGRSTEEGSKIYLNDDKLTINIAHFKNKVSNSVKDEADGIHLGPGFTSKGYEISITGDVLRNLHGLLSFSTTKLAYDGDAWPKYGYPKRMMRAFLTYDLPGEKLRGWSVGGGATLRSAYDLGYVSTDYLMALSSGETPSIPTRRIPSQAAVDANVSYTAKSWSATLGAKNLTGRTLYGDWAVQQAVPVTTDRVITFTTKFNF